jgi:hypothetical protein
MTDRRMPYLYRMPSMDAVEFHQFQAVVRRWFDTIDVDNVAVSLGVLPSLLRAWGGNVSLPLPPPLVLLLVSGLNLQIRRGDEVVFDGKSFPVQIPIYPRPSPEQRNASYWIPLFYGDQKKADALVGDLDELFHKRVKQYGRKRALRWYRVRVAWSLISLLRPLLRRIVGLAAIRELWHRIVR